MKGSILLKNGRVFNGSVWTESDIFIEDGIIRSIGSHLETPSETPVVDLGGKIVSYGLVDVHVHFRVPGRPDKEDMSSGSLAAAKGGYTCVCTMPNLDPVPDTPEHIALEQALIDRDAIINVLPYSAITIGRKGRELVDFSAMKSRAVAFSDDGSGVQDDCLMRRAMTAAAAEDVLIAAHCEDTGLLRGGYIHDGEYAAAHGHRGICSESEWSQVKRDIALASETGCRYHVCHVSTEGSVEAVRQAKAAGANVSCETAPHYLVLTDADLQEDGRFKMNPPLRSATDRDALLRGILDGTIEVIATDHAPHTEEEKSKGLDRSAMGITGLETAFPVLYTRLVKPGTISLEALFRLMSDNPRRIFRLGGRLLAGEKADLAVFDIDKEYTIDSSAFSSKGHSTPFDGWKVCGRCVLTLKDGNTVWKDSN